jgi:TPR repeat protein
VDTDRAIAACEQAIAAEPGTARFHYQLGRAQVYAADRAGTDWNVGMPALQKAAEGGHVQGMFVLGLMYKRAGDICASEPWTRRAAEAGLKSARISYVNDALAGVLSDCQNVPDSATLASWLDAARTQVSGFYENMLIDALSRGLSDAAGARP